MQKPCHGTPLLGKPGYFFVLFMPCAVVGSMRRLKNLAIHLDYRSACSGLKIVAQWEVLNSIPSVRALDRFELRLGYVYANDGNSELPSDKIPRRVAETDKTAIVDQARMEGVSQRLSRLHIKSRDLVVSSSTLYECIFYFLGRRRDIFCEFF